MKTYTCYLRFGITFMTIVLLGCGNTETRVSWARVPEKPDPTLQAAIRKADTAADLLGGRLMSALQRALVDGGPSEAIRVCQEIAPRLAEEVRAEQGVQLGRTSFRLRNQSNRTPVWAQAVVQQQSAELSAFVSSDGVVGRLRPIPMMPLCAQCHGGQDEITPEVREVLATYYPSDRATGFRQGEVRGYFWVEVEIDDQ